MPIKVFQVVECGGPGGTGHQVAALCNGLDPKRFETTLVYAVRPGSTPKEYEQTAPGASRYVHIPEMVREIRPLKDLRAFYKLYRLFKEHRPDVVHAHSSKAGVLARKAAWMAGISKIYYTPHGFGFQQTDRSCLSRSLYALAERLMARFGEIVAVSESEAALARNTLGASRVSVARDAYLGTLAQAPRPEPRTGTLLVAAAGRLSYPRNPEAFVRLAWRAVQKRPGLRFLWIGDGELRPQISRMVSDLHLEKYFEISGWLPPEEAVRRLGKAHIAVHYTRWEGLPNAVLDAMAQGLPVVASNIGGNRDLVSPNTGRLADDERELLAHVLDLAADSEARKRLGEAGWETVGREYQRQRLINEISALYL